MLVQGLHSALDAQAEKHGFILKNKNIKEKFAELIQTLGKTKGPVVVIIDEYDKPIIDLIDNLEQAELSRIELKDFYGTLKGNVVDANMHFLFVTGVSKFSKGLTRSKDSLIIDTLSEKFYILCLVLVITTITEKFYVRKKNTLLAACVNHYSDVLF
jgi:hypothetical protein